MSGHLLNVTIKFPFALLAQFAKSLEWDLKCVQVPMLFFWSSPGFAELHPSRIDHHRLELQVEPL